MADYTVGDYMGQEGAEYWTRLILEELRKLPMISTTHQNLTVPIL